MFVFLSFFHVPYLCDLSCSSGSFIFTCIVLSLYVCTNNIHNVVVHLQPPPQLFISKKVKLLCSWFSALEERVYY